MPVTLSHDAFDRSELVRQTVPKSDRSDCDYCGSRPGKFRYEVCQDGLNTRPQYFKGAFCSKSCCVDYHRI